MWRLHAVIGTRPLLLMPGRLSAKKGQLDVIDAMAKVRDALGETFVCVIVGDDQGNVKYRQSLEARIEKLNLWPVMRLAGHCNDMPAALKLEQAVMPFIGRFIAFRLMVVLEKKA